MAFFCKAAQVKMNSFWQYKVFSIVVLWIANIDPECFFYRRPYSVFPVLLDVCSMMCKGSIQKPREVVQNHNACLKNECVWCFIFTFKSSMLSSFSLLSSSKASQGLSGHIHKLSPQPEGLGPFQERWSLRVPVAGSQSAESTGNRRAIWRAPQDWGEYTPSCASALQPCCTLKVIV